MENTNSKQLIPSFQVDHSHLLPGIYESRVDTLGDQTVTTFDIRMKQPNAEPVIHANAMHTIEHIIATFLRHDEEWKDRVIYWGPMGCLTGCYLILKGHPTPREVLPLMIRAFDHLASFEGEIPGARPEECGNYIFQDLNIARYEGRRYAELLRKNPCFVYPGFNP